MKVDSCLVLLSVVLGLFAVDNMHHLLGWAIAAVLAIVYVAVNEG